MKLFLFDFDGVIIDTLPIAVKVYNSLFRDHNLNINLSPSEFTDLFTGNFHQGLKQLVPDDDLRDTILSERTSAYINLQDEFQVFPGIKSALIHLSKHGQIIIISSNDTRFIKSIITHKHIPGITDVLGGDIDKSKTNKIRNQQSKHKGAEVYYTGDTVGDIIEGRLVSAITVAVSWGFHSRQILLEEKPDYLFDSPSQLLELCQPNSNNTE